MQKIGKNVGTRERLSEGWLVELLTLKKSRRQTLSSDTQYLFHIEELL